MKTFYVLMNLNQNIYYKGYVFNHDVGLTKNWKEAKHYESKEEALEDLKKDSYLFKNHHLYDWTTREFFQL